MISAAYSRCSQRLKAKIVQLAHVRVASALGMLVILALAGCSGLGEEGGTVDPVDSSAVTQTVEAGEAGSSPISVPSTVEVAEVPPSEATPPTAEVPADVVTPEAVGGQIPPESGDGASSQARTYVVQPGDTLTGLSVQFDVSVAAIAAANGIEPTDFLYVDQVLTIPVESPSSASAAPAPTTQASAPAPQDVPSAPPPAPAVPPAAPPPPPPPVTDREPVVVNGRTYDAYVPSAIKDGQWYQYTCEFDAAWIVLKTYGYDVSLDEMLQTVTLDTSIEPYYEDTPDGLIVYGGDILNSYSGDYKKNFLARSTGQAMRKAFEAYGLQVTPVQDRASLEAALLRGELVWIKTTVDFKPWRPVTWVMPDGNTVNGVLGNDHALVVMGFNDYGVVIKDPLGPTSTNWQRPFEYEVPWEKFMAAWGAQNFDGLAVAPPGL